MTIPTAFKNKSPVKSDGNDAFGSKALLHVLVVDDNNDNAFVTSLHLKQLGCIHDIAGNGREALILLNNKTYDAILMDIKMPDLDGYELVSLIREQEQRTQKPRARIIAVTAMALVGDRQRCLDCGMDDYIAKPYDPDTLRKTLGLAKAAGKCAGP